MAAGDPRLGPALEDREAGAAAGDPRVGPALGMKEPERQPAARGWVRRWGFEEPAGSIATVCRQQQNLALEICGGIRRGLIGMRRTRAGLDKRRSQHEDGGYVS